MNSLNFHSIVATFEMEPIFLEDSSYGSLKFRIEIFKNQGKSLYFPKIYKWETFRVQPTFPQDEEIPTNDLSDNEILVKDFTIDCNNLSGKSIEEVLEKVASQIKNMFFLT